VFEKRRPETRSDENVEPATPGGFGPNVVHRVTYSGCLSVFGKEEEAFSLGIYRPGMQISEKVAD
jgi:hypothetical protein